MIDDRLSHYFLLSSLSPGVQYRQCWRVLSSTVQYARGPNFT